MACSFGMGDSCHAPWRGRGPALARARPGREAGGLPKALASSREARPKAVVRYANEYAFRTSRVISASLAIEILRHAFAAACEPRCAERCLKFLCEETLLH